MIKKNQKLLNQFHVFTDAIILYCSLPAAFWIRFYILPGGTISVPMVYYLVLGIFLTAAQLITYAAFGLYRSFRRTNLRKELLKLWSASGLDMALLLSFLFVQHYINFSRGTLAIYFFLSVGAISCKRILMRNILRRFRQKGYNQKHVLLLGSGEMAQAYLEKIEEERELGYQPIGYVSRRKAPAFRLKYLGAFADLARLLEAYQPDEVISAIEPEDYQWMPQIIS
ncbi:MAG: hypothetical protein K2N78_07190, partial [Oscillospiraceae bacterium]|nr:hypothetical protein [Oscillospiraceae bacterium]